MPPINSNTERLLGQLIAEVKALNERLDRNDRHTEEHRDTLRDEIKEMKGEIDILKKYMTRVEGGKSMLLGMLTIAAALGGLIWEIISGFLFKR